MRINDDDNIYHFSRKRFLNKLGYDKSQKKPRFEDTIWGRLLLWVIIGALFGLYLGFSVTTHTFQNSYLYLLCTAWVISLPLFLSNRSRITLMALMGLDGKRPTIYWRIWFWLSAIGAFILSIYILLPYLGISSDSNNATINQSLAGITPAVLAFSLPVVSTTLSAISISGANYPKITVECRLEALRAGHKLALATGFFILFVLMYFLLTTFSKTYGQVDPSSFAWGKSEIYGGVLFWLSTTSLFFGPFLLILGSGELLTIFMKLRRI